MVSKMAILKDTYVYTFDVGKEQESEFLTNILLGSVSASNMSIRTSNTFVHIGNENETVTSLPCESKNTAVTLKRRVVFCNLEELKARHLHKIWRQRCINDNW